MAKRISQLVQITRAQLAVGDLIPVVDISSGQTKYVTIADLTGLPDTTWTATAETWTYNAWTLATRTAVFNVPTDATTKYSTGMLIRFSQTTGGTKYGVITAVTATTLTAVLHPGYTLNNETVTSPMYTPMATPYGAGPVEKPQLQRPHYVCLHYSTGGDSGGQVVSSSEITASFEAVETSSAYGLSYVLGAGSSVTTTRAGVYNLGLSLSGSDGSFGTIIAWFNITISGTTYRMRIEQGGNLTPDTNYWTYQTTVYLPEGTNIYITWYNGAGAVRIATLPIYNTAIGRALLGPKFTVQEVR